MASPTQWTWVWVNSGSWQWTWRPGVLQSMGLQKSRIGLSNWKTTKQTEKRKPEMQEHIIKKRPRVIRRKRAILGEAACLFRGVTSGRRAETWLRRMSGYRAQGFFTKQCQGSYCKCVQLSYCPCSSMITSIGFIHGIGYLSYFAFHFTEGKKKNTVMVLQPFIFSTEIILLMFFFPPKVKYDKSLNSF